MHTMRPALHRLGRKNRHVRNSQRCWDALRRESHLAAKLGGLDRMPGLCRHRRERRRNLRALLRRRVADGKALVAVKWGLPLFLLRGLLDRRALGEAMGLDVHHRIVLAQTAGYPAA